MQRDRTKKYLVLTSLLALTSCTAKGPSTDQPRVVNLASWSNYVSPELLADFEKRTGIKVQISNYSSNEELLAKLQAGASGYDVAIPSDYMVFAMGKLGLLKPLDFSLLTHSKSLDPKFLKKSFDPENKISVPYDWGTTGIAVNRALYKGEMTSWKNLLQNKDLEGKFTLLDDGRETIGATLKMLGLSLNTKNPSDIQKAKDFLIQTKARVKGFTSEPLMSLVNGETAVAHAYVSDTLQARRKSGGEKIEYVIPGEGCTLWIDNLVIPTGAQHLKEAHEFINFLLEAKSNVSTVMSILVAPANREAFSLLPREIQTNSALFPSSKVMAKMEMMEDLGQATNLWDRVWTEVKAGK